MKRRKMCSPASRKRASRCKKRPAICEDMARLGCDLSGLDTVLSTHKSMSMCQLTFDVVSDLERTYIIE